MILVKFKEENFNWFLHDAVHDVDKQSFDSASAAHSADHFLRYESGALEGLAGFDGQLKGFFNQSLPIQSHQTGHTGSVVSAFQSRAACTMAVYWYFHKS